MDHSLRSYLSRRTSAELGQILNFCMEAENPHFYQEIAMIALDILQKQKEASSGLATGRNGDSPNRQSDPGDRSI